VVNRNKVQVLMLVSSTEYLLYVLVLVSESLFLLSFHPSDCP
jgi:hypothetical protein